MSGRLFLVDGSGFIFRAFFGIRRLSTSDGVPTNAVMGFATMMKKVLHEHKPTHVAVVFDTKEPTFRHELYPAYKANRPEPPADLVPQFGLVRRLVDAFRWTRIERPGFEADDIIGTLSDHAVREGMEVVLVTSDKDFCQLLGPHVRMLDTMKDQWTGPDDLKERFGGGPESVVEVLALAGDKSDNVPGIPGVGEVTALKLLQEYGSVENVLANAANIKGKVGEKIAENKDKALLSRRLVTIKRDMDLGIELESLRSAEPDWPTLTALLTDLQMTRLLADLKADPAAHVPNGGLSREGYRLVLDMDTLKEMEAKMRATGVFAVDLETTSLDTMRAEIVGLSFCCDDRESFYVPVAHYYLGAPPQLAREKVLRALAPMLEDPTLRKIGQNIKYDWIVFENAGVRLAGVDFDTMIGSYLLTPESGGHNMDALALRYLRHKTITYAEVTGKGAKAVGFDQVPLEQARDYAAEDAHVTRALWKVIAPMVETQGLDRLMRDIEMPLVAVLVEMERDGVMIDLPFFKRLSGESQGKLAELEKSVHEAAGAVFNLNSPKQVGEILFEKLGLKAGRKTKSGFSTDVDVLEKLAETHEVPRLMLEYRAFHKLKSTYIDALPLMVNPRTGRLHTSYNQAVTATGRLSSSDPNLQNIPIRTPEGRRIREGFTAPEGCVILSADYSQVELRILAHLARDKAMIEAFRGDADIHAATAAEVFNVMPGLVTPEQRRQAKAINFGIVYGMSAFRLGQDLSIRTHRAQEFIDAYFARFSGVRDFIESTIAKAREDGFVTTLMGRRRAIPELKSTDRQQAGFGERIAVNTPIQGTAADIIKIAMIRMRERILRERLPLKMILQVHDELVFETPEKTVDEMAAVVREVMENVVALDAPLKADTGFGKNWASAH